ncbi:MAG: hypothetical protein AW07_03836 [Candidatus Accumulibacter sp. SK-11]|nr:MAG: hypothetical protein AW07_03836 [Candidatus Accumulibacter sp. SK-11]
MARALAVVRSSKACWWASSLPRPLPLGCAAGRARTGDQRAVAASPIAADRGCRAGAQRVAAGVSGASLGSVAGLPAPGCAATCLR